MDLFQEEPFYIDGKVAAIYFENPQNFYKVMRVEMLDTNTDFLEHEVVVTGSFGAISTGEEYHFVGRMVEHVRFGKQFQVDTYAQIQPTSKSGVVTYLSSEKFQGIGKRTAEKIVDILGVDAIEKILDDPSVLEKVSGFTKKKREMLVETLRLNYGMEKILIGLNQFGFGSQLSIAIYNKYQANALDKIHENPYQLIEDIDGIGFTKADQLAEQLGFSEDSSGRIQAAIMHKIMENALETGDTYAEAQGFLEQIIEMLEKARPYEIAPQRVADEIIVLVEEGKIQQEEMNLFENSLYFAECGVASKISRMIKSESELSYQKKEIEKCISEIEKNNKITYAESQKEAMIEAIQSPFFILTGGPGTGKTTVIRGIVELYAKLNGISLELDDYTHKTFPILLAAPTGRASKRMNETAGLPAGTIHRMLGLTGHEKNGHEEIRELEGGLLIVDEFSMVDTWLANMLFKAINEDIQVIFVGDKDQLPSVSPGQVLHDLLQIEEIPKRELTEIFRQKSDSSIIPLAHEIKNGYLPADFAENKRDRSFFFSYANNIEAYIRQIVEKAKGKGFTQTEIQVLAPMYRGLAGINALNVMLQEIFNPNDTGKRKEVKYNDTIYRIGDKILHLVNAPEVNVFNGDFGRISGISYAKDTEEKTDILHLDFDGVEVSYPRGEWNKITLSYATSIHKAQGSEFDTVILPFVMPYRRMLQRNLLYTAITRAKKRLILLGEVEAFHIATENESAVRKTRLKERLAEFGFTICGENASEEKQKIELQAEHILTLEDIDEENISAMIGMEGISPFDFL
ncbi:exodeoxyribonuclease V alpha subunit [Pilibacter termitis]|uniref:ATP-dependent RecD2 DNA helicase n=1 Tax=Pilibacter termitis TaxID=263852 RepID=A0A1T4NJ70_9ENTE|nr:ATP-dependent RecD-like DNA helicase [Pilibacter termitis]SJZ79371.1 exodeoxyribonuclease V alpha subunit [Pilibacter termitis]